MHLHPLLAAFEIFWCLQGLEYIPQLQAGDTILTAKVIAGGQNLIIPQSNPS